MSDTPEKPAMLPVWVQDHLKSVEQERAKDLERQIVVNKAYERDQQVIRELRDALVAMLGENMPPAGEPGHIDYADAVMMARAALANAEKAVQP